MSEHSFLWYWISVKHLYVKILWYLSLWHLHVKICGVGPLAFACEDLWCWVSGICMWRLLVLGIWHCFWRFEELVVERGAKEKDPKSAFPTISSNHHHVGSQMVLAKWSLFTHFYLHCKKERSKPPYLSSNLTLFFKKNSLDMNCSKCALQFCNFLSCNYDQAACGWWAYSVLCGGHCKRDVSWFGV